MTLKQVIKIIEQKISYENSIMDRTFKCIESGKLKAGSPLLNEVSFQASNRYVVLVEILTLLKEVKKKS